MSQEPSQHVGLEVHSSAHGYGAGLAQTPNKNARRMNHHIGRASGITVSLAISEQLLRELWVYSFAVDREISGIGEVHGPASNLLITDPIHLLKQQGNFVNTILDIDEVLRLLERYITTGKDPETLRFWYHSHSYHPAFFSEQDRATIRKLSAMMPVCVVGVVNHEGDSAWEVVIENSVTYSFTLKIPGERPTKTETDRIRPHIDKVFTPLPRGHREALMW